MPTTTVGLAIGKGFSNPISYLPHMWGFPSPTSYYSAMNTHPMRG